MEHGLALGEASQDFAGIAEHDATGTKTIDDVLGKLAPIGRGEGGFAGVPGVEMRDGFSIMPHSVAE